MSAQEPGKEQGCEALSPYPDRPCAQQSYSGSLVILKSEKRIQCSAVAGPL